MAEWTFPALFCVHLKPLLFVSVHSDCSNKSLSQTRGFDDKCLFLRVLEAETSKSTGPVWSGYRCTDRRLLVVDLGGEKKGQRRERREREKQIPVRQVGRPLFYLGFIDQFLVINSCLFL